MTPIDENEPGPETAAERERFQRLEAAYRELEGTSREQRERRLAELEASDADLFPELRQLAERLEPAVGSGLDELADQAAQLVDGGEADEPQPQLGSSRFRLLRRIGSGGMGEVWEAEQTDPVSRRVAIKILRGGLETPARVARFEAERQALATMSHPNIAGVFDGGETADGKPYFVMELVEEGIPITEHCNSAELGLEERLALFRRVCTAVEHAHSKQVIHRDLKPSNVLVSQTDDEPSVKVIDFGIAKPLEERWATSSHETVLGEVVGTPVYMSPEQAALGATDIDTRSDVFTLGLLLFELITGALPLTHEELRNQPFDEVCRRIREEDPPTASAVIRRLTSGGATSVTTTWRRVQGDLDRILYKALAKDRDQRYQSVAAFADDVQRFLRHEPVLATPPSRSYRLRKFVRRHRVPVAAAVFLVLGLAVGLLVAIVGFTRARAAEAEALSTLSALERSEEFLVDLFQGASPRNSPGTDPTATELLRRGIEKLDALDEEPRVKARLLWNLGEVQRQRGDFDEAESLLRQAIEILETDGSDPLVLATAHGRLGAVFRRRSELRDAERELRRAVELFEEHDPNDPQVGGVLNDLAIVLNDSGRYDASNEIYNRLIERLRGGLDGPPDAIAAVQFNAANNLADSGDPIAAAEALVEPLATFRELLPENHPHFGTIHANLAVWYARGGRPSCALRNAELGLAIDREVLPPGHTGLADTLLANANALRLLGELERAAAAYDEAESIFLGALGPGAERVELTQQNRAGLHMISGRAETAAEIYSSLIAATSRRDEGPRRRTSDEQNLLALRRLHAVALRTAALGAAQGVEDSERSELLERAETELRRGLAFEEELSNATAGERPDRPWLPKEILLTRMQLALVLAQQGRIDEARTLFGATQTEAEVNDTSLDDARRYQFSAQFFGLTGETERALDRLGEAVRHVGRAHWIARAPELSGVTSSPRYGTLVQELDGLLAEDTACVGVD